MTITNERGRMPWQTKLGAAVTFAIVVGFAALNVAGWVFAWGPIVGGIAGFFAFCFELLAFVLWEHIRAGFRGQTYISAIGGMLFLAAAVSMNAYGGHQGLEFMARAGGIYDRAEQVREQTQAALDRARAAFQSNEIAAVQQRIDAVTPPDLSGGPQNDQREIEAWQLRTAEDRRTLETLQRRLDAMPLVAVSKDPFPSELRFAISALFALVSVFGLSVLRVHIPMREQTKPKASSGPVSHRPANVVNFKDAQADKRDAETVRRLKAEGKSFREIEDETGISKSRAHRMLSVAK